MKAENFARELETLKKRRRTKELQKRIIEGPKDPWRATRHGPKRDVILTANKAWFEQANDPFGANRVERFEELAVAWLTEHFGEDVVHARADLDEETYHIHAVIFPRATTKDGRRMLQPSKHPMIKDYEAAQDSVGQWFAAAGLVRGERRKAEIRKALQHDVKLRDDEAPVAVPDHRQHLSPADWRKQQERDLAGREADPATKSLDLDQRGAEATAREASLQASEQILETHASALAADRHNLSEREGEITRILEATQAVDTQGAAALETDGSPDDARRANLAQKLFGTALARLRKDAQIEAQIEAETAIANERRTLAKTARDLEDGTRALAEIFAQLPPALKEKLTGAAKTVAASLVSVRHLLTSQDERPKRDENPSR